MNYLTNEELSNLNGGAVKIALSKILMGGGIATFIIGVINGYLRPLTCKVDK